MCLGGTVAAIVSGDPICSVPSIVKLSVEKSNNHPDRKPRDEWVRPLASAKAKK